MYRTLLQPALSESSTTSLVISPSGLLMAFPFEALIMALPDSEEVDFRLPYLVNKYDVSYQYSSSLVELYREKSRKGDRLLAVGFSGLDKDSIRKGLADLPGTREELSAIHQIMADDDNVYLLHDQASEGNFKRLVEDFNLLHLAVHGISDTADAVNSRLVFGAAGSSDEDGSLYAHELYALDLRKADLAVLSACESGVGKLQAGEGLMSISRGFAYAGCPSLVISLWKIDDQTSPAIMADFYGQLAIAEPIDRALSVAKRNYLGRAKELRAHPSFWAAFLAVGETKPVMSVMTPLLRSVVSTALVALVAFGFFWWRALRIRRMPVQKAA